MRALLLFLTTLSLLYGDDRTQKMTARLSEEAEAFLRIAPEVLGTETLHQSAVKPPGRFHPRIGNAAPRLEFQDRDVISEYGFAAMGGAVHELRQVISVDGHKTQEAEKAQAALAKAITASDDARKKEVLKQFEKVGLQGAVTDFGQILLLFTRRELSRYEFAYKGARMIGYDRADVFSYKQLDGPEALTVFDEKKSDQAHRFKVEGEIRVRAGDDLPLQITLAAHEGDGPAAVREEAAVTYAMSKYGALLPVSTEHRELRGGKVVAENRFSYSEFHRFGASSDIKFESGK